MTSPSDLADALEALAVENDEVDAIVSGGEHRAPLLRAVAQKLRQMDEALALVEAGSPVITLNGFFLQVDDPMALVDAARAARTARTDT